MKFDTVFQAKKPERPNLRYEGKGKAVLREMQGLIQ